MASRLGRLSSIGTNFALAVGGMGLIGYFLDRWLVTTKPWLLLTFLLLGLIGGFYNFVREGLAAGRQATAEFKASREGLPPLRPPPPDPPSDSREAD